MRKSLSFATAALSGLLTVSSVSAQNQPTVQVRPATTQLQDSNQSATTVKQAIAKKLMMANKAEIELAQLAQQKSKNQQVSQLADTLISDHRNLNEKLQQWAPAEGNAAGRNSNNQRGSGNQPGIQPANQQQPTNQPQSTTNQQNPNRQGTAQGGSNQTVPQTLCKIMDQASSNALSMTKEMLQKYEGEEFDMAFVGQQTVAHMMLLAELKAIQDQNLDQISQIAGQAATTTEQHLEELKRLAKELKDNSGQQR